MSIDLLNFFGHLTLAEYFYCIDQERELSVLFDALYSIERDSAQRYDMKSYSWINVDLLSFLLE